MLASIFKYGGLQMSCLFCTQGLDDEEVAWGDPEVENMAMLDRLETYGGRAAELVMKVCCCPRALLYDPSLAPMLTGNAICSFPSEPYA